MNRFIIKVFVIFLAIGLWDIGFFEPVTSDLGGQVSIAEASHRGGGWGSFCQRYPSWCERLCRRNPSWCQPPTVSELPIQYMVLSGIVLISLCGGTAFYIRKRKMENSPEA